MKKKVCLAMSLLMLAGTVPAQAETIGEAEQITFTAKVGTKELYRNQFQQVGCPNRSLIS